MPHLEEILTIGNSSEKSFKEKGSLFTGLAYPLDSEEKFGQILGEVKKKYYDASHHCYAYKLIDGSFKYSDDGEPSGTAGVRILNAIDHFELLNTLVIVVRYFGGTKLGIGGLGKAYYNSAKLVLKDAEKIKKTAYQKIIITAHFEFTSLLHRAFSDFQMKIIDTEYSDDVKFICYIKPALADNFKESIIDKTKASVKINVEESLEYL